MDTAFTLALLGLGWYAYYFWYLFIKEDGELGALGITLSIIIFPVVWGELFG